MRSLHPYACTVHAVGTVCMHRMHLRHRISVGQPPPLTGARSPAPVTHRCQPTHATYTPLANGWQQETVSDITAQLAASKGALAASQSATQAAEAQVCCPCLCPCLLAPVHFGLPLLAEVPLWPLCPCLRALPLPACPGSVRPALALLLPLCPCLLLLLFLSAIPCLPQQPWGGPATCLCILTARGWPLRVCVNGAA